MSSSLTYIALDIARTAHRIRVRQGRLPIACLPLYRQIRSRSEAAARMDIPVVGVGSATTAFGGSRVRGGNGRSTEGAPQALFAGSLRPGRLHTFDCDRLQSCCGSQRCSFIVRRSVTSSARCRVWPRLLRPRDCQRRAVVGVNRSPRRWKHSREARPTYSCAFGKSCVYQGCYCCTCPPSRYTSIDFIFIDLDYIRMTDQGMLTSSET